MFFNQHLRNNYHEEKNECCDRIVLSDRAYATIISEAYQRIDTETGGILLGHYDNGTWYVVEVIDPGMKASYSTVEFEYDGEYVTHLLKKISKIYKYELHFLGAWHRHPGSMDTFSHTDDIAHKNIVKWAGNGAISLLVNFDPDFRISAYYVDNSINYWRVKGILIGNKYCNPKVLEFCEHRDFENSMLDFKNNFTHTNDAHKKSSTELLTQFKKTYIKEIRENIDYYSSMICLQGNDNSNADTIESRLTINLLDQTDRRILHNGYIVGMKISSPQGYSPLVLKESKTVLSFHETEKITILLELIFNNSIISEKQYFIESIKDINNFNIYLNDEGSNYKFRIEAEMHTR